MAATPALADSQRQVLENQIADNLEHCLVEFESEDKKDAKPFITDYVAQLRNSEFGGMGSLPT